MRARGSRPIVQATNVLGTQLQSRQYLQRTQIQRAQMRPPRIQPDTALASPGPGRGRPRRRPARSSRGAGRVTRCPAYALASCTRHVHTRAAAASLSRRSLESRRAGLERITVCRTSRQCAVANARRVQDELRDAARERSAPLWACTAGGAALGARRGIAIHDTRYAASNIEYRTSSPCAGCPARGRTVQHAEAHARGRARRRESV